MKLKGIFYFICLVSLFITTGCTGKGPDVSGKLEGVWETKWDDKGEGIDNLKAEEIIAFLNDEYSNSKGKFRQVFFGDADIEDGESCRFVVTVSGTWSVEDTDGVALNYNTADAHTYILSGSEVADTEEALKYITGDWNLPIGKKLDDSIYPQSSADKNAEKVIDAFFKGMFSDMNEDDPTMLSVVVKGSRMECKVNPKFMFFLGRRQKYELLDVDITDLTNVKPEEPQSNLPNYDWLSERYADYSDVSDKDSEDLRIMRNYIYARHGHIFKSPELAEYFSQYSWYEPRYTDVGYDLNNIEIANVTFIQRYE